MKVIKQFIFSLAIISSLALVSPSNGGEAEKTFIGQIADTQCALNVHSLDRSHKVMIKTGNAGKTPADCSRYCVSQRGGKFVLQTKTEVYKLSNQELAEKNAGMKVKVVGTLDPKTNYLDVRSIQPIEK